MTGPFLSLTQVCNRLILTARRVLRDHRPGSDGRCLVCRTWTCAVATIARDVLRIAEEVRRRNTATGPAGPERDDPQRTR
ncbi:hypothetical protein [Micromonospora sp. NBS 11-29]|uniref:hypothetical protein n=1 Tax=Micromonospora sp. NBS 11-29 TaxID=1960879 RepID=UPI000B77BB3D|nr:hypothetical protein [Micromonospora sp. NBS 11-29]